MKKWQQLIKERMGKTGISQEELAEKVGVSQGSIAHWLSGRRKPDTDIVSTLMKAVGLTEITLNNDGSSNLLRELRIKPKDSFCVEVLELTASAGAGMISTEIIEVIRSIEYNNAQAQQLFNGRSDKNIKIINIKGDSMQGTFESGDLIFVDISINSFDGDGIYVFNFGKGLFIKRLQLIKNSLLVISDNKFYKEWSITEDEIDQLYIHGKVLFSQSMKLRKHG